jgi:hypothetical protein
LRCIFFIGTFILILPDALSASASGAARTLARGGPFASDALKRVGPVRYLAALVLY